MQVIDTSLPVLVTGGSGFIGSNLIKRLLDEGYQVRSLDLNPLKVKHDQLVNITGNYTNKVTAEEAVASCSVVYHLASTTIPKTSIDDPGFDISSNLLSTVNLLDLSVKHFVVKFIFASSGGIRLWHPQKSAHNRSTPNRSDMFIWHRQIGDRKISGHVRQTAWLAHLCFTYLDPRWAWT